MQGSLFEEYDQLVVLDTETTGISCFRDEIIELAAIRVTPDGIAEEMDEFIRLSPGRRLPYPITQLTGITEEMLREDGIEKQSAAEQFADLFCLPRTLIVAYNAQFDLCFLYFFLKEFGRSDVLKTSHMLDALTVFKDRRPYPHKLKNAIEAYEVKTQNTHRAVDDAKATLEVLEAMERERDDLLCYVDLFGYYPRYGLPKPRIASVRYAPQYYDAPYPLYEIPENE